MINRKDMDRFKESAQAGGQFPQKGHGYHNENTIHRSGWNIIE